MSDGDATGPTPASTRPRASAARAGRRFLLDNLIVLVAQVLQKLRGLVTLPLIVRGLGTEAYGVWAQFVAFTALAGGIVGLSLHLPLVRTIASEPRRAAVVHTTLLVGSLGIGAGLSALALGVLPSGIVQLLIGTPDRRFLWAALLFVVFSNARTMALSVYRATDRIAVRSLVELSASLVDVVGVLALLWAGHGLDVVVLWMAASALVVSAAASTHALRVTGMARPDFATLKAALGYSLPLVPNGLAQWVLDRSDRVLLAAFLGQAAVGAYSAHYAVASLVLFVQTPLQVTLVPKVSALWDRDRATALRYLTCSFRIVVTFALGFVVGLPLVAEDLFLRLANREVASDAAASTALVGLGVASWGLAIVVSLTFYVTGKTSRVASVTAGAAAVNVVLNVALLPRLGLLGAGIATAVAYAGALAAFLALARRDGFRVDGGHVLRCAFSAVAMAAAVLVLRRLVPGALVSAALVGASVYVGVLAASGGLREDLDLLRGALRR